MARVDTLIAGAGIALLVASAGGLLWVQEFAGLQEHTFPTTEHALAAQEQTIASGARAVLEWHQLPDNATAASIEVTVAHGQAVQGGQVTVEVELEAPDGTRSVQTQTFTIAPAAAQGNAAFQANVTWAPVPEPLRAQQGDLPSPLVADGPLRLQVTVQGPGDVPLLSSGQFTVSAEGVVTAYEAASG